MHYFAASNRCAVHLPILRLPISDIEAVLLLHHLGFEILSIDIVSVAYQQVGTPRYQIDASIARAPAIVDCSSFTKWLYAQKGVRLPRYSLSQNKMGATVALPEVAGGDLIFTAGIQNFYDTDPREGAGHVGIATENKTVIHASWRAGTVIETPFRTFLERGLRGIRRIITHQHETLTLSVPSQLCVETSDDIRCLVLKSL